MNRTAAAILAGVIALVCIVDIAAGYLDFGELPSMGTVQRLDPSRSVYVTVTPAGATAGVRPGDVLDLRTMDMETRAVAWAHIAARAGETYRVPLLRDGAIVYVPETLVQRPPIFLDLLDVIMRVLLAAAGVFLIARGTAKDSLYAGIFVLSLSIYEGFAVHYWGPPWVAIVMTFFGTTGLAAGVFGGRLLFAFELLPAGAPRVARGALLFVSWAAFAAFRRLLYRRAPHDAFRRPIPH
ncbi:MAG TPA: hypothetical protein VFE36_14635 [Candidatus Baltobacteraceae bacterium]|nr:hypothetical protein [Candidatus Baltobacteraceae bacterium]